MPMGNDDPGRMRGLSVLNWDTKAQPPKEEAPVSQQPDPFQNIQVNNNPVPDSNGFGFGGSPQQQQPPNGASNPFNQNQQLEEMKQPDDPFKGDGNLANESFFSDPQSTPIEQNNAPPT